MTALRTGIAQFCTLAVCGVLLGAFYEQFAGTVLPCPLCMLQRMAMVLCAAGPAWILALSLRRRVGPDDYARGYGASVLGAVLGAAVSARQVLLHIEPGDPGYGEAVLGLHLYTWAFVVFVVVLLVSGLHLMLAMPAKEERLPWQGASRVVVLVLLAITALNAVLVFALAGFHAYLPDDPTGYRLFEDLGWSTPSE
ncbi:MAG: disulfide bond formation protein B [Phycisphaerales bacterium]